MNKRPVILILAAFLLAAGLPVAQAVTVDRIMVVVNDEIITESDLESILRPVTTRLRATVSGTLLQEKIEEARLYFLRQLVDDRLIISEAKRMDIKVDETEIDEMMADMRKRFSNPETFENALKDQGITVRRLRDRFKNDILKRKAIDFKVRGRISVSPAKFRNITKQTPTTSKTRRSSRCVRS